MTSNDEYVIQILVERGFLTQDQVDAAAKSMKAENETTLDVLVSGGTIGEDEVLGTVADQFGLKYCHVNADAINPEVVKKIPADIAKKYGVVPVVADEDSITVALSDPMGYDAIDSLRYVLHGLDVQAVIAPRAEVNAAMAKIYAGEENADVQTRGEDDGSVGDEEGDDSAVIKLANLIITTAIKMKASDIHIEPMEKEFRVRYRIDGALRKMDSPPKRLQGAIISRIKIMSKMKISEKRIPQDGRIQITVGGKDLDLRVSSVPTNHGESIVMRILDKTNLSLGLPQLGFLTDDQATFERLIKLPDGVVLVTGPTGSGKTTTLYACLGQINTPDKKLITVEDPVEYQMSGINQVQVNKDVGLDFSAALRSILRQAPNIVMIGRDGGRAYGPPRILDSAHERRAFGRHPSSRYRRQAVPRRVRAQGRNGPATRPRDLREVQGVVHADRARAEDARQHVEDRSRAHVPRRRLRQVRALRLQGPEGHLRDLQGRRHDPAPHLRPRACDASSPARPRNGHAYAPRGRHAQGRERNDEFAGSPARHDGRRRLRKLEKLRR